MSNPSNQSKSLNLTVRNQKSNRRSLESNLSEYIDKALEKPKQSKKNKKGRRSEPVLQSVAREGSHSVFAEKETIAKNDESSAYQSSNCLSTKTLDKMIPEMKNQYDKSQVSESIVSTNFDGRSPEDKIKTQFSSVDDQLIEALPEQVTNKDKINVLATLYSQCIRMHLVPNILMEIYLLFQLLTIKESKGQLDQPKQLLLGSVHNCVYFATAVLNDQVTLLVHLDRATLALLVQIPRLEIFSRKLQERIQDVLSTQNICSSTNPSSEEASLTSVRFQLETDARETFPDAQTFQDSRKQRDMFYDMLRHWSPSTKTDIGHNVIKLLSLQSHPVNLRHFANLFIGQLIASAACLSIAAEESDDLKLLPSLKTKVNSDKLLSRIVTRSQFGGPCPDPAFSGSQEFFKEFIMHSTFGFVTHLKDLLSRSILAKNEIPSADQLGKLDCGKIIIELRILAKFLGFIETLPYQKCQTDSPMANELLEMRRREEIPCLDLEKILQSSRKNQKLIITIPWIVEYCSMLDPISIKLPYYQSIFKQLINIYKFHLIVDKTTLNKTSVAKSESNYHIDNDQLSSSPIKSMAQERVSPMLQPVTEFNAFFLCIQLGWLFERPSFPRELFVGDISLKEEAKLYGKTDLEELQSSLDSEASLKSTLLYQCCPFVSELKELLKQFQSGFKAKRGSICAESIGKSKLSKEIMMRTSKAPTVNQAHKADGDDADGKMTTSRKASKSVNMQDALVANFFHNQSRSIEEAVETVTKRISNNFVCKLRNEVIPDIPDHSKLVMQNITDNLAVLCSSSDCEKIKEELLSQVASMSETSQARIQKRGNDIVEEQLAQRVHPSLHCLLPEDTKEPVVNFCGRIIEKRIKDEANEWMKNNLAKELSLLLQNQFDKLWNERIKELNGSTSVKQTGIAHLSEGSDLEDQVEPIYEILIRLKNETSVFNSGRKTVPKDRIKNEEAFILSLLGKIQRSFATEFSQISIEEKGNLDSSVKGLERLTFDWALTLFIHCPKTMTPEVQQKFIELWGGHDPKMRPQFCLKEAPGSLATLFSPRNLHLLSQSRHLDETWTQLDYFTGRLLRSGLLLPKVLQDQCLELLRKELPDDALKRFGMFLRSVVDSWQKTPHEKSEFMDFTDELLDWFPYIFSNINSEYDDNFPMF